MTVVVTGASGFLGRTVVERLLRGGHDVVGIDRRPAPFTAERLLHLQADLTHPDPWVRHALASADAVAHLAGAPGVRDRSPDAGARRQRDNVEATRAVLGIVPAGTPLAVTSSSSVYGGTSVVGRASSERDALRPAGGYARSKAAVEQLCAERAAAGGAVAVLRPFTVAGEHQRPDMALALWLRAVAAGEPVHVLGSLGRTRDVTDVRDVAEVVARVLERDVRETLNVGTGRGRSLAELLAAVEAAVGRTASVVLRPAATEEPADTLADTGRLARLVGHVPETDLRDLVERQLAAAGGVDQRVPQPAVAAPGR